MKRIIGGVTYNTDTSSVVARYEYLDDKEINNEATVYQTRGGAFFIVHQWMEPTNQPGEAKAKVHFEPIDREGLTRLAATTTHNLEIVDSSALEEPPEATASSRTEIPILIRLPASLKQRLDDAARHEDQSTNSYALRCIENCTAQDAFLKDLAKAWHVLSELSLTPEVYNKDGCLAIASTAQEEIENALARWGMKIADVHTNACLRPGDDVPYFRGDEYSDLHEDSWKS